MLWDVFISHASEDKAIVARPLAQILEAANLRVWLDEAQLRLGDSLRERIDEGLAQSRFGIVILSPAFFAKQWTHLELDGWFARETSDQKRILPVWHEIDKKGVAQISPLLAGRLAALTRDGIPAVAQKIIEAVGKPFGVVDPSSGRYCRELNFPRDRLDRAIEVIQMLADKPTWKHLEYTREGYPAIGWMGTDSTGFCDIFYDLMAPLVEFRGRSHEMRRNLYVFEAQSRLGFGFLEAALGAFFNESDLANMDPAIAYSPRFPGWHSRRQINPHRYWWQGISAERFDQAMKFFLDDTIGSFSIQSSQQFRDTYRRLYHPNDHRGQYSLGVLGNALYGFTPEARPVFYRLLMTWAILYATLLGDSDTRSEDYDLMNLERLFPPTGASRFPFRLNQEEGLFEPFEKTVAASCAYLNRFVVPKLRSYLALPSEDNLTEL